MSVELEATSEPAASSSSAETTNEPPWPFKTSASRWRGEPSSSRKARLWRPQLITCDVRLRIGRGPQAVAIIQREMGTLPVIFITATPEDCVPSEHPARVLAKPMHGPTICQAFRELAPI